MDKIEITNFNGFCKGWHFDFDENKTIIDNLEKAAEDGISSFFQGDSAPVFFRVSGEESDTEGDIKELKVRASLVFDGKSSILLDEETLGEMILALVGDCYTGKSRELAAKNVAGLLKDIAETLEHLWKPL